MSRLGPLLFLVAIPFVALAATIYDEWYSIHNPIREITCVATYTETSIPNGTSFAKRRPGALTYAELRCESVVLTSKSRSFGDISREDLARMSVGSSFKCWLVRSWFDVLIGEGQVRRCKAV